MFTRRVLFKTMAAMGAGALLSVGGRGAVGVCSTAEASGFIDLCGEPIPAHPDLLAPAVHAAAIERWENFWDDLDPVELLANDTSLMPTNSDLYCLVGRCPFCRQGPESFRVLTQSASYSCEDCCAHGHVVEYYAQREGCLPLEAITQIRGLLDAGLLKGTRPQRERFQQMMDVVRRFTRDALLQSREGGLARAWLDREGISPAIAEDFSLSLLPKALGRPLLEHLRAMGFSTTDFLKTGVEDWIHERSYRVDGVNPDHMLLLPVRDHGGACCGFYEQTIEMEDDWSSSVSLRPSGYERHSLRRTNRLIYSVDRRQRVPISMMLSAKRPWDVVRLTQGGLRNAVYLKPLGVYENLSRLEHVWTQTERLVYCIHASEIQPERLQLLCSLPGETLRLYHWCLLPEGVELPELLQREGLAAVQARLAEAVPLQKLIRL